MRANQVQYAVHMQPTEFASQYVREHLTLDEILRVPGVERLVINAKWEQISESFNNIYPRNIDEPSTTN